MHSKHRVSSFYPELEPVLPFVYHRNINKTVEEELKKYDHIPMDQLALKTFPVKI